MNSYLITYDLMSPGQDYSSLHESIEKYNNYWKCLESVWIIKSDMSAKEIRNELAKHVDQNDKLLVAKLSGEAAWRGFSDKCSKWLKDNL